MIINSLVKLINMRTSLQIDLNQIYKRNLRNQAE
jgi:hypothetical protein